VRRPFVALLLVGVVQSGCGGGGDPSDAQQVRSAVAAFAAATAAKDYRALCDRLLAPKLVAQVRAGGRSCEAALEHGLGDVRRPRLAVASVRIDGDSASVAVRSSARGEATARETLELTRIGGSWRIASLGSAT
jgi:ketosteroid isomerase-like protein